jgi:hypothetical protein
MSDFRRADEEDIPPPNKDSVFLYTQNGEPRPRRAAESSLFFSTNLLFDAVLINQKSNNS